MNYYIICGLFALLTFTDGHNWLMTPKARNFNTGLNPAANEAATSAPCDSYAAGMSIANATVVKPGDKLSASWSTNHAGPHELWLIPSSKLSTLESLAQTDSAFIGSFPVSQASTTVTIPKDLKAGAYILQYRWSNYRNCADLKVEEAGGSDSADDKASNSVGSDSVKSGSVGFSVSMIIIGAVALAGVAGVVLFFKFKNPVKFAELKADVTGH